MKSTVVPDRSHTHATLFDELLDNAAIFPPGNAPMEDAVRAHLVWRASRWAQLVGPFICASTRWSELVEQPTGEAPLAVSLTFPGGPATVKAAIDRALAEPRIRLASLEVPCSRESLEDFLVTVDRYVPATTHTYVELPWAQVDGETAAMLVTAGARLKVRTGGTQPAAFPNERQLAEVLAASVRAGLPFKLTAGLHDPIRHRDAMTGFEHHGYLNVVCATARAITGADLDSIVAALAQQNPVPVADEVAQLDEVAATQVRNYFISFGTCSLGDPVTGLLDLDLIGADR